MSDFFKNGIVQSIIASLAVAIIIWLVSFLRSKDDERKILSFLRKSSAETHHTFRSTHSISAAIKISEEKIRKICIKSSKIDRNQKEKESWRLSNK